MDEPFVSLDEPTAQDLRALLRKLCSGRLVTVLFVTHNTMEAVALATRVVRVVSCTCKHRKGRCRGAARGAADQPGMRWLPSTAGSSAATRGRTDRRGLAATEAR